MLMNMCEWHTDMRTLIVLKWVHWLVYLNHLIRMSYTLDNLKGKPHLYLLHKLDVFSYELVYAAECCMLVGAVCSLGE